ncbi:UNVERIFIED_CONTAM: Plastidial pyruvate kinase [Sesamum angustifolium]|uniref:Pyruvate kinase n=1 Tax=Sesamum angustifolium TaxID=2727405 RepID=A0AAW2LHG6_9LAMI
MAQVVATRLIHGAFAANPGSGSLQSRAERLRPTSGFETKVFAQTEKRSCRGAVHVSAPITARRSSGVEPQVIPVSPEDVPKVLSLSFLFLSLPGVAGGFEFEHGELEFMKMYYLKLNFKSIIDNIYLGITHTVEAEEQNQYLQRIPQTGETSVGMWSKPTVRRKTKIVCTIGPSTNTREMIWKLAEAGMNVARLNMSHETMHLTKKQVFFWHENHSLVSTLCTRRVGPEVRSGDLPQPITLTTGQEFTFTIRRGVGTADCVSVNYDDFVNDVEMGDMLLVDGGMMSLMVKSKTEDSVKCEVVDGGELKSRRHLNVRGKSATLPSITEKDWDDIKFGVDNKVDFYAVSFVKDAAVVHELKNYLKDAGADIHVIVKIESADSIPNLHSIITASDGLNAFSLSGYGCERDLGAELPIEEVPLLQEEIITICRSMGKAVIVATNMLESMIVHPTPTRAEVSDIAIAVREGADAVMLSGETAHGKFPLKAVKVMHTVSLRTEATMVGAQTPADLGRAFKNHMSEMFAFHATMMSNTLGTSIVVFTRTGFMAILLSHFRPSGTIFAFTNEKRVQQRLALYQGVCPIHMEFSADAEDTFSNALALLQKQGMVKEGEQVALVQSGRQPIWRFQSTHNIQVRKV